MERLSRWLSWALRHDPNTAGIALDDAGWTAVDPLLAAAQNHGQPLDRATLERLVHTNAKQRFELDGDRIRARQGHSVPVQLDHPEAVPPTHLFHGTVARFLPSIRAQGLLPGDRHAVHLSADPNTAAQVGARRGHPVVLTVRAADLHACGTRFSLTSNGVWLVAEVPPDFLQPTDTSDDG